MKPKGMQETVIRSLCTRDFRKIFDVVQIN